MSTILLYQDEELPLVVQLADNAVDQFPKAVIANATGTILGTVNLTHTINGVYANLGVAFNMPVTPLVTATYFIYSDIGYTTENPLYSKVSDIFVLRQDTSAAAAIAAAVETALIDEFAAVNANIDGNDVTALAQAVQDVKVKTDQMVFTNTSELDVNVKSKNNARLYGTGIDLDKWRGSP